MQNKFFSIYITILNFLKNFGDLKTQNKKFVFDSKDKGLLYLSDLAYVFSYQIEVELFFINP